MRFFCILAALALPLFAEKPQKPNILFLLSDDQAWEDYGFMGHEHIDTPVIDQLAAESLTFTRGYTPVPLCRPSLATIVTGLYPHEHGITGNDPTWGLESKKKQRSHRPKLNQKLIAEFNEHPNIMRALKEHGYLTLQTGKWWEGHPVKDSGFTHGMTHGDPERGGRHGDVGLKIGREGQKPIYDFIEEAGDQPWFIWYGVFLPHTPHNPPKDLLDKYLKLAPTPAIARYWANCEWHDRAIGELLDHLKEIGELENTVVIYTTDNGWIQKPDTPQRYDNRSKQTMYEGGIRTPIMLSWKGQIEPRMDRRKLATNLDMWPTISKLTGCSMPDNLHGLDLLDHKAIAARDTIYGEDWAHNMDKEEFPHGSLDGRFIIEGDWKLITFTEGNRTELYNLALDPWEKKDLAAAEPERVAKLSAKLNDWWKP
ncbi:MAG: sulfatase-like hydrolase/transferase [Akkermansiaceae bacterium]|nr:sulfatase-like hydrolase/transferase [Akkermansiaceae bacterium]